MFLLTLYLIFCHKAHQKRYSSPHLPPAAAIFFLKDTLCVLPVVLQLASLSDRWRVIGEAISVIFFL